MTDKKNLFAPAEGDKKKLKRKNLVVIIVNLLEECNSFYQKIKRIVIDQSQNETLRLSNELIAEFYERYGTLHLEQKIKLSYRQCADLNQLLNLLIVHYPDLYKNPNLLGNFKFSFKCTELAYAMDRKANLYSVSRRIQRLLHKLEQLNLAKITIDKQISVVFHTELGFLWAKYRQKYLTLDDKLCSEYQKLRSGHARLVFLTACEDLQQHCCKAKQYFVDYAAKFKEIFSQSLSQYQVTHKIKNNLAQWHKRIGTYCQALMTKPVSERIITAMSALCFSSGAIEAYQNKVKAHHKNKLKKQKKNQSGCVMIEAEKAIPIAESCSLPKADDYSYW